MWQKLSDLARLLVTVGDTLQRNRTDIKELQVEVRRLSTAVQLLAREVQHGRESKRQKWEKLILPLDKPVIEVRTPLAARQRGWLKGFTRRIVTQYPSGRRRD